MSELRIYAEHDAELLAVHADYAAISHELGRQGIRFERWQAHQALADDASQDVIIAAYRQDIDRLMVENGFQAVDVVSLTPSHPDKAAFRQKFLHEHTHSEHEVRFFVDGQGLFYLHLGDKVYAVLCEKGDLISVPAGVTHWFDMGPNPFFKAIRLFTNPAGWVAHFTGSTLADRFPRLEN